jgi:beta-lactamase regulating signal transducer with metallopeptidase domain
VALQLSFALDAGTSRTAFVLAFVLTYVLHSVVWCGAAALAARARGVAPSTQSYVFLAALLGPFVTATIAIAVSAGGAHVREVELLSSATVESAAAVSGGAIRRFIASSDFGVLGPASAGFPSAMAGLLIALGVASMLGALRFLLAVAALKRRLRDRIHVQDARILQRLQGLRERAGLGPVALTQSTAIDVPLVLGRSEICLPARSLSAAPDAEIDAVLAHELGHILRGDGLVFPLVSFVQSAGWYHPLHHWIASRYRHAAELACDDCSIELTGDPLALAHALTRVAHGALLANGVAALPAMARPRAASVLLLRVRRLVGERVTPRRSGSLVACCAAVAVLTMGLTVRAAGLPQSRAARASELAVETTPTEQIGGLMRRAAGLERESESLQRAAAAGDRHAEARFSELQQEVRHVRETAAWIERKASARE